ncbi:hypothetical protein CH289_07940 [Rhodococcus sp. RS1C4]|nr:hypothetical protein [Rhodococcus sp. RS1C4]OZC54860.1 hypothetical protein CH289_07940 [Rhodococcus sp. RS1C4]
MNTPELQLGRIEATKRRRENFTITYQKMREKCIDHATIAEAFGLTKQALDSSLKRYKIERIPEPTESDYLATELRHFTKFGFSVDQIAERLGYTPVAFKHRLTRYGIDFTEEAKSRMEPVLERLIEGGEDFTIDHLPGFSKSEAATANGMLDKAVREGRIKKAGTRPGLILRKHVNVYRAVDAAQEVAA